MIKRSFSLWVMIIGLVSVVFGQTLDLQVSTTLADINTPITATITVAGVEWWWSVAITGIEAFDILNQSRSQSIQVVNGRQASQVQLTLSLQPKAVWTYTLGPATIETSNGTLASPSAEVEVSGESLFGTNTQLLPEESSEPWLPKQSFNRILRIFLGLILVLVWRVYKVFRTKQNKQYWSVDKKNVLSVDSTIQPFSGKYSDNKTINNLIYHAVQSTDGADEKTSLSVLQQRVKDWNLQWLLGRIEMMTYWWNVDPLLEDDIHAYFDELN